MDNRGAKVEQAVFDFLRPKLKQYRGQTTDLARAVATSISKVISHAEAVVEERRRQLRKAEADLDSCLAQEDADCSGYARRVQLCQRALADAIRGRALIHEVSNRFQHSQSKHTTAVDQLILQAERLVRVADERTTGYQKSSQYSPSTTILGATTLGGGSNRSTGPFLGGGGGGGSSTAGRAIDGLDSDPGGGTSTTAGSTRPWSDWPGVEVPPHFPARFALVPIKLIANDNPVTGPHDFDAAQNLRTLTWATDALLDVVMPVMRTVVADARQYLRDRDAHENLTGSGSYSATYSGFFSENTAIKLSPLGNGTFDLQNGRHRLWLLSRAGVEHVPAYVRG